MIDCSKTMNYFIEKSRMIKQQKDGVCKLDCSDCPLSISNNNTGISCSYFETGYPEEAIAIMQKWSDEHPQKTYLSEFLKYYPNAPLGDGGTPTGICPYELGLMGVDDCRKDGNCVKCWNQPIEESDE
jgi:hypothetical protein